MSATDIHTPTVPVPTAISPKPKNTPLSVRACVRKYARIPSALVAMVTTRLCGASGIAAIMIASSGPNVATLISATRQVCIAAMTAGSSDRPASTHPRMAPDSDKPPDAPRMLARKNT